MRRVRREGRAAGFRPAWPRCGGCGGPARPEGPAPFRLFVPVVTLSETNRRDRWGRNGRKKDQRERVFEAVAVALGKGAALPPRGPWYVRLTRHSANRLDPGNLSAALKTVEDQFAACLGVDDGSAQYEPCYAQAPRARGVPEGVLVEVWGS